MFNKELAASVIRGESFNPDEVISGVLIPASDFYYNGEDDESPLSDAQYDYIARLVRSVAPFHSFFTGVGAEVRGGKIELPFQMGSLDQVEIGELAQWKKDRNVRPSDELIVMAKLDGSSGAAILNQDASLRIGYSRGNGIEGADITRHLSNTIRLKKQVLTGDNVAIRGENIIGKKVFTTKVQPNFKRRDGKQYVNPRNAVSGMMNASENNPKVYQYIDYVAYQRVDVQLDVDKDVQLQSLEDMGFKVPWHVVVKAKDMTEDYLAKVIENLRDKYEYEIDGVVVELNKAKDRAANSPEALNPGYAMKYKVPSDENQAETRVVEVEWNASKHGYGKPRVIVEAVALPGIIWTYATGYNAKWIKDNGIGPGAVVVGQRMGDVVPNIIRVVKSVDPQMPEGPYRWNDTKVDIILEGDAVLDRVLTMQLTETARSLDIDGLREGTAEKIVKAGGYETFNEMFSAIAQWPRNWWGDLLGENGGKIYDDFHNKMSGVPLSIWLGSMPHFGRGIGRRKMTKLCEGLGINSLDDFNAITAKQIVSVDGFADKSAYKIMAGMASHKELFDKVDEIIGFKQKVVTGNRFTGQKVVFTGFRDGAMEKLIEAEGGEMQTSISSKTTLVVAADITGTSGKLKKVHEINSSGKGNIKLMDIATFRKTYIEQQPTGIEF